MDFATLPPEINSSRRYAGPPAAQTGDSVGRVDFADIGHGDEQLSESVTLTKLEREILAVVRRYTAGQ